MGHAAVPSNGPARGEAQMRAQRALEQALMEVADPAEDDESSLVRRAVIAIDWQSPRTIDGAQK